MYSMSEITQKEFEDIVTKAIDNVPDPYQSKLKDITFRVEERPSPEKRIKLKLGSHDALFGLYEGVPLPARGGAKPTIVPDVITVYMYPMVYMFPEREALKKQVYETVWHEVAHYFGLNHEQIHKAKDFSK